MQRENQEQRSDDVERGIERTRLNLEQQQQRAQEQRNSEITRSVEQMRLRLEQQQREEANDAEAPLAVPRFNPPRLAVEEALIYVEEVQIAYIDRPHIFKQFLDTLQAFKCRALNVPGVLARIRHLFNGNPQLIDGFNKFLPPNSKTSM